MITLEDFIKLGMEDYYKINIYDLDIGEQIITQESLYSIPYELNELNKEYLLYREICTWDINDDKELTINL